jgi:hypothetical protein
MKTSPEPPRLVGAKHIAEVLSITVRYALLMAERGEVPSVRIGAGKRQIVRFHLPSVLAALQVESAITTGGGVAMKLPELPSEIEAAERRRRRKLRKVSGGFCIPLPPPPRRVRGTFTKPNKEEGTP